jgi:HSP20 family protein
MSSERDLFANFERMRREMDELFGDVFDRGLRPHRRQGFTPAVDVYYLTDPPRAVVKADLAGVTGDNLELEIRGRELVLSGHRRADEADGRVYQQLEIEHGGFRRVVSLGVEVDPDAARAVYRDGMLTVELPVLQRSAEARTVPISQDTEPSA